MKHVHLLSARLVMLYFAKVRQLRLRDCRSESAVNTVGRQLLQLSWKASPPLGHQFYSKSNSSFRAYILCAQHWTKHKPTLINRFWNAWKCNFILWLKNNKLATEHSNGFGIRWIHCVLWRSKLKCHSVLKIICKLSSLYWHCHWMYNLRTNYRQPN